MTTNTLIKGNSVVGIYETHANTEAVVKELQQSGFDLKKLSFVGRDYRTDEHVLGYYNAGDQMKYWGKQGAFWAGFGKYCSALRFFWFPDSGLCWLPVRWSPGSWAYWKAPSSSVA
jgi:hypothetical protein